MNRKIIILCIIGGAIAGIVALSGRFLVGSIYSEADAKELLQALADSGLYFGSAIATSSATILALMLTLLAFANRIDKDFDIDIYKRVDIVALLCTINLCIAMIFLMILTLPIGDFKNLPDGWYPILYNSLYIITGLMVGIIVTTVLLLFSTIRNIVRKITPSKGL